MILTVLRAELTKLRRSGVPLATLGVLLAMPLFIALLVWIVADPARAAELGLLGAKANLAGMEATWDSFADYTVLAVGTAGMMVLAFILAHLFGSEYAQGTARVMLTLPIRRSWFALSKLGVAALWWLALASAVLVEALALGAAMGLAGMNAGSPLDLGTRILTVSAISFLLAPATSVIAVASRGYLAPVGFALGMLLIGNALGHTGWAQWFPWSVVPILVGTVSSPGETVAPGSWVIVSAVFILGVAATCWLLERMDVDRA